MIHPKNEKKGSAKSAPATRPARRKAAMTGEEFRKRRDALGWTQADTAEALALSIAQISAMENARSAVTPTVAMMFKLYRAFDRPGRPTGWMDAAEYDRWRDHHGYTEGKKALKEIRGWS